MLSALTLAHCLALLAVWQLDRGWLVPTALAVAGSLALLGYRYGWSSGDGFVAAVSFAPESGSFTAGDNPRWTLAFGSGARRELSLTGYYCRPWLVVLNFSAGAHGPGSALAGVFRRRSVAIAPDAADRDQLRRLRRHLVALANIS